MTKKNSFLALISLLSVWFFVFASSGGIACGAEAKETVKDCVSMNAGGINDVLKKLNVPDAKVLEIADSPIKGFCEVIIEIMGQMKILYLDVDRKYLISGVLLDMSDMSNKTAMTVRRIEDKKRIDVAQIPVDNAICLGEAGAPKKVVVFTDPDCPFCAQLDHTIRGIVAKRKDIAFYIKFLPLEVHQDAYWKAKSIVCSRSATMLEDNFERKEIPKKDCTTDEIDNSIKLAHSLGIGATPSLILPDGRLKVGAWPEAELLDLIDGKK